MTNDEIFARKRYVINLMWIDDMTALDEDGASIKAGYLVSIATDVSPSLRLRIIAWLTGGCVTDRLEAGKCR